MKWTLRLLLNICVMMLLSMNFAWAKSENALPNTEHHASNILLPPLNEQGRVPVALAYHLLNISQVNEETQSFSAMGYLIAQWEDPRLAYTPTSSSESYRIYQPTEIWLPLFTFSNAVETRSSRDVIIYVYPDGLISYFERTDAKLSNELYLRDFPFDTQNFDIQVQPSISQETYVDLVAPTEKELFTINEKRVFDANLDAYSVLENWSVGSLIFKVDQIRGYIDADVDRVNFIIQMERRVEFYLFKVFFPLCLMLILSWTVFWIETSKLESQITLSMTTILIATAFAFAIDATTPKVPYLTFSDAFFLLTYFFVFSTTVIVIFIHGLLYRNYTAAGTKVQSISRIAFPILFLLAMAAVLLRHGVLF